MYPAGPRSEANASGAPRGPAPAPPLRNDPDDPATTACSNVYNNILEPRRFWLSLGASL